MSLSLFFSLFFSLSLSLSLSLSPSLSPSLSLSASLQTPLDALQEQCNSTSATNSHVVLRLEHAQSLLAQFSEGMAEVSPWLQETQSLIGQLSLSTISYEAFREQQELLQVRARPGQNGGPAPLGPLCAVQQ